MNTIGIIGVGGVGGYFGGKLCHALKNRNDAHVLFVARGEHLRTIQRSGLVLCSEADGELICKPALATDDFLSLPPLDICLLCVKEFDLADALSRLKPKIGDGTVVIPLLNGVDVPARVRKIIKKGIVLPACVYVGTHIERPGVVTQKGGACKILFGPDPLNPEFAPGNIVKLFDNAKIKTQWTPDIQTEIWQKFIFIASFGLISAACNNTLGEILESERLSNSVDRIMNEVIALSKKAGVSLPANIAEISMLKARTFPPETKTSFQRDFERPDRQDERDLFAGSMLRMGKEFGVQLPETSEVAARLEQIKPWPKNAVR